LALLRGASGFCRADYETYGATREQFAAFVTAESTKYADVVRRTKAALD
jgi:hypothetical protein